MNPFQESQAQIRIHCPQCGGDIGFLEESHAIRCEFCGTSLIVAGRDGILRYVLPNHLETQIEAEAMALEHLRGLGRIFAEPKETFLFYAPFWRLQGQAYRWVFGAKPMKVETEEGVPPPMEKMKVLLTRILDHTIPGYSDLDLGISSLGIRSQAIQLQPFNQEHEKRKNSFLSLSVPLSRAREEAEGAANIFFEGEDLVSEVILQSLVGRVFSVVYFPIWLADCQHSRGPGNRPHRWSRKESPLLPRFRGRPFYPRLKDDGKRRPGRIRPAPISSSPLPQLRVGLFLPAVQHPSFLYHLSPPLEGPGRGFGRG